MLIKLPDIVNPGFNEVYVGQRKRLATASGCTFLSDTMLAVVNMVSQRIFIIKVDFFNNNYEIIDSIETTFAGKLCDPDLITSHNKMIATSNFDRSISIYEYHNEYLTKYKEYGFPNLGYIHGIKYYTDDIICFTTMQLLNCVCFFDIKQEKMIHAYVQPYIPKDICFLSSNRMVVIYNTKPPTPHGPYVLADSKVQLIEFNLEHKTSKLISEFTIPQSHIDSCDNINNLVHITTSQENKDTVYVLDTKNDKLYFHNLIEGFHIPHGIATFGHLLAVTSYFDNTVKIIDLREDKVAISVS